MSTHQEAMSFLKRLLGIILLIDSAIWFNGWAIFTFVSLGIASDVFTAAVLVLMGLATLIVALLSKIKKPSDPKDFKAVYNGKLAVFGISGVLVAVGVLSLFI